jgi:methylphosphotriester-DNA--protein-cysteine methyltransferase
VWGDRAKRLADALDRERSAAGRRAALARAVAECERAADPIVAAAARRLSGPGLRVADVCDELGVGERRLHRRVTTAVGYGPKTLARVLRLRRLLDALDAGRELPLAALDAGFADQAHMSRDCLRLTGLTPGALAVERLATV